MIYGAAQHRRVTEADPGSPAISSLLCRDRYGIYLGLPQGVLEKVWHTLTAPAGDSVVYVSMEIGADADVYHPVLDRLLEDPCPASDNEILEHLIAKYLRGPRKIPNYSGGLGVLAGDTLKSFADNHIPVVAISLLYRDGYFSQYVDSKVGQIDQSTRWSPEETPTLFQLRDPRQPDRPLLIQVPFFSEYDQSTIAYAHVWLKLEVAHTLDFAVPELLLDYSVPESPLWVQEAGRRLYNAKSTIMKANQRRMLGSAILPVMDALGISSRTIHLNEQHGIAVALQLVFRELRELLGDDFHKRLTDHDIMEAVERVSKRLVYTIHTPVKAGHDRFDRSLYAGISHSTCRRILDLTARDDDNPHSYNFTSFAMRLNRAANSVSRLHRDVTKKQFPRFADKISAITNGVHHLTWISPARAEVFDNCPLLQGWRDDPGVFAQARLQESEEFRRAFSQAWRHDNILLVEHVNAMLRDHRNQMTETWIDPPNFLSRIDGPDSRIEPGVFTIGFARRFSTYKRADLIFDDMDALCRIMREGQWRVNFLFAGKAHPEDEPGKSVLKLILDCQEELYRKSGGLAKLIFLPGYDMQLAKRMVAGVHAWLNSPKRPLEASGTSGMKAAMNGVPNISIMDGWWVEGYHDGRTGWKFGYEGPVNEADLSEDPNTLLYGEDSQSFYQVFDDVLTSFHATEQQRYLDTAIRNLVENVPIFNTHRMAAEYVHQYGLHLPEATRRGVTHFQSLYHSDSKARPRATTTT